MGDGKEVYDTVKPRLKKPELKGKTAKTEGETAPQAQEAQNKALGTERLPSTAPAEELAELKQNLRVSFSRMKDDIHYNRQQNESIISANLALQQQNENMISANLALQEQLKKLQEQLKIMELNRPQAPRGLNTELMRGLSRNKKGIIKQRILSLAEEGRYTIPDLKEIIVEDKRYCSKASFYRYVYELNADGSLVFVDMNGRQGVAVGRKLAAKPSPESERYV